MFVEYNKKNYLTMAREHWRSYDNADFKSMKLETHLNISLGLLDDWTTLPTADKNFICNHINRLFMSELM